jgi:enoyl-CoA hydratase/carnithine racemase
MERLNQLKQQLSQKLQKIEIDFEDEGRVAIVYLNSPKDLNAMSLQMRTELLPNLSVLDADP